MKKSWILIFILCVSVIKITAQNMKPLTKEERQVIIEKGTEAPFSGKFDTTIGNGTYICRQCGAPLYKSTDKFESGCGWPAFDDEIKGAIKRIPDADDRRTEIVCAKCGGHLGHVFEGEHLTAKNVRHCVNAISLQFKPTKTAPITQRAIFAGGCFWGVEHLLQQQKGVKSVVSGYIGGITSNPTYQEVSAKKSGHAEAVEVTFDPHIITYEQLAKLFFEIHDPTQSDGQGPDIGHQYRSEIFYNNPEQKRIAEKLIEELKNKGYKIVTKVTPATTFYKAENYHQDYYEQKGTQPYCHKYTKRF